MTSARLGVSGLTPTSAGTRGFPGPDNLLALLGRASQSVGTGPSSETFRVLGKNIHSWYHPPHIPLVAIRNEAPKCAFLAPSWVILMSVPVSSEESSEVLASTSPFHSLPLKAEQPDLLLLFLLGIFIPPYHTVCTDNPTRPCVGSQSLFKKASLTPTSSLAPGPPLSILAVATLDCN